MNLSKPFIRRPVMTTLLMLPLIVFGIFAYKHLPVSAIPVIESSTVVVTTTYPGASSEEVAKYVSAPLERQFILMQGIQFVTSENDYQSSTIICQFHDGVNIDVAAQNVQNAINQAAGDLPPSLPNPPSYTKANPSDTPILYAVVHSKQMPFSQLYEWGYSFIGQQIGTVQGIADIQTYGYPYAVRVKADPQALASRDISFDELANAINNANPDLPTGAFYGPNRSIQILADGQIIDPEKYNDLIIKYQDGEPVRLRDVATASQSLQNDKSSFRWITHGDGEEGVVVLAVLKQQGFNTVDVCNNILALMDRLKTQLPASIELTVPFTQSVFISQAVEEVEMTLIVAFILVVLVVYIYLGKIRNSVIPLIALPITVTGTFMLMYVFGYNIDIMSMSALTLSIGFLVDDAIIVLENIVRYVEMNEKPYKAALIGSRQIIITVVSISMCLAAVFIPMLFLGGAIGKIFHEFGAVIIIAIIFSAFISFTLTPMLCSRFIPPHNEDRKTKMELVSEKINAKMIAAYKPALQWCLKHRFWVFIFCVANLVVSVVLFKVLPKEFLPPNDLGVIEGFLATQQGTSPDKLDDYLQQVTDISMKDPAVNTIARIDSYPTDNQGIFFMNLVDVNKRKPIWDVINDLYPKLNGIPGVRVFLKAFPLINLQVGNITAGKAAYQYLVQGFKEEEVFAKSAKFLEKLHARPELAQVSSNMLADAPMLKVNFLRDPAHSYGNLNARQLEQALMYAYGETYISKINTAIDTYYVILQTDDAADMYPDDLSRLYVGENEDQVSMDSVLDYEVTSGPLEINNINTLPSVTVSFNPAPGHSLSEALTALQEAALDTFDTPTVFGSLAGNTEAFKKTFIQLTVLLFIAIFIIYLILGILYENFIYPIVPLSALPVAVMGGLLSLLVCRQFLSIYAMIGLIMLIGIVMKNGILIIDFALEEMHENGKEPYDAVLSACILRFRPIIMTTLAAMMGSVPIALGIGGTVAQGRAPLGIAVVGGLLFSQVVTLFVIPAFFLFICKFHQYATTKWDLFKDPHFEDPGETTTD